MRKKLVLLLAVICVMIVGALPGLAAGENTTYTYTLSTDDEYIRTQDAYLPGKIYLKGQGLKAPEDLFLKDGLMYIADTGNGRIVKYNPVTEEIATYGEGILSKPGGIFVRDDGTMYVADYGVPAVVVFSPEGEELLRITRPDSPLFSSRTEFKPHNVVVTSEGNIFVVSTGTYEGLMQFSDTGEFQGFFAANQYYGTFLEKLQDLFMTEIQLEKTYTRIPLQLYNIDISDRDLIYSVTQTGSRNLAWSTPTAKNENAVKLHNMAGNNILSKTQMMADEWNFVDVVAGPYDNCYALTQTGLVYEYDSSGNLVFTFGGRAVSSDRNGLFTSASAIDIDENGFLYILDKERMLIQVFTPTDFAVATHRAIYDLESGNYEASEQSWLNVLKLNGMSKIAHIGYGKALFHQQKFDEALEQFEMANYKEYYSESFWEIRAQWLNHNIVWILVAAIALYAVYLVVHLIKKRRPVPAEGPKEHHHRRFKLWDDVRYVKTMLRHPIDGYYYLKRGEHGSVWGATILYLVTFIIFLVDMLFRGFVFNYADPKNTPIYTIIIALFVPLFLYIIGNYMVSSINEGEGSLKNVYVAVAYSLAPYIFITPFVIASTYVLTLNEAFIVTLASTVAIGWSAILIFLSVIEIHNYSLWNAIKNVLLTAFFMVMAVVVVAILYLIWGQVIDFIKTLWAEVKYRAFYQ